MIDPEYTRMKHQSCTLFPNFQSKGLRSVACWPAGADRRNATHAMAAAAMMAARISVDCRQPEATPHGSCDKAYEYRNTDPNSPMAPLSRPKSADTNFAMPWKLLRAK